MIFAFEGLLYFAVGQPMRPVASGTVSTVRTRVCVAVFQWNSRSSWEESIHRLSLRRVLNMSDKQHKISDDQIAVELMPAEVQRLTEIMRGVNPDWSLEAWLSEQANAMLELVQSDLNRERMVIEQRLHRLQAIQNRFIDDEEKDSDLDPNQRNIFDCFDLQVDSSLKGLGKRTAVSEDTKQTTPSVDEVMHPANNFIELLPDDESDDPLLAVVCQMLLIHVDSEMAKGLPCATLETIFKELNSSGISPEEIDEALDYSLMNGTLIEIDDDCFVPLQ